MAARRAERLVNLVICLLSTRRYLTAEQIRTAVTGYDQYDGDPRTEEAFKRMFERDKAELRDLGIPLETGRNSGWESEDGYRISRRDYELPPIEFEADEAAAVGLASRLWESATLGAAARTALVKLRAGGTEVDVAGQPGSVPQVDASDPGLPTLLAAARSRQAVTFEYAKAGSETPEKRTVEPWGVLSWRRRWYVVGHDRARKEPRSFRLSRILSDVKTVGRPGSFERPEKVDLLETVTGGLADEQRVAHIRVSGRGAGQLRRMASGEDDGVLTITFTDVGWLSRIVASAGTSARVLDPPDLATAVAARLKGAI